jgi:hypothetical protein
MTRSAFLLVLLSLTAAQGASAAPAPLLDVRINRLQGLLDLALSYCGVDEASPALRKALAEVAAPSALDADRLRRFCGMDRWRDVRATEARPRGYGQWSSPWWRLQDAAVLSPDLKTFERRIVVDYDAEDRQIVLEALAAIEPRYVETVERPLAREASTMADGVRDHMRKHRVDMLLAATARFYGSPRAADVPWTIGLSPVPAGGGSFSATVNGQVVRSFMPVDSRDYTAYASVVVHEVAHVLFGGQPLAQVDRIRAAFRDAPSPNRRYAEAWLNEALATAVGNGWAYRRMAGSDDTAPWYDDSVIDAYARAIAPAVYARLDANAPMDEALMAGWAAAFDRALPDARADPDVLLQHLVLVTSEGRDVAGRLQHALRTRMHVRALTVVSEAPADQVPEEAATILRVELGEAPGSGEWTREEAPDGRLIFQVRLRDADAFAGALEALVARIRADAW